jgi:hypothetical protein
VEEEERARRIIGVYIVAGVQTVGMGLVCDSSCQGWRPNKRLAVVTYERITSSVL